MIKKNCAIGMTFLFIVLIISPMVIGYGIKTTDKGFSKNLRQDYIFDRFNKYHPSDLISVDYNSKLSVGSEESIKQLLIEKEKQFSPIILSNRLKDSAWPMFCHDVKHTGQSPYSTAHITGFEKWRFNIGSWIWGSSPVIDNEGIIYFGEDDLYAFYPNGTLKWIYDTPMSIESSPAIDENGIIYVGTVHAMPNYLFAIYSNNGTLKWKYGTGNHIYSSPAIANDGTIYFGDANNNIRALNSDGTLRWSYKTDHVVYSSPAIGKDSTVYCGSHDTHLYALYPNNGTLKWKYKTGHWIRVSPCIADDGTIYVVSLDDYLHAVNPDGTLKWKTNVGAGTSPTIGQDGTIYAGYSKLYALNPIDGSVKWIFNPGSDRCIRGATPCNSVDGTIYFGTWIGESGGGEIIAINSNGVEKWRKKIANDWVDSAPVISEDGTIYICSTSHEVKNWQGYVREIGYIHAFGPIESNNPPEIPTITGETNGEARQVYHYKFNAHDPDRNRIRFNIDWGDGSTEWTNEYASDETGYVSHKYLVRGKYIIKAKAQDTSGVESDWTTLDVSMPKSKSLFYPLIQKIMDIFPNSYSMLKLLLKL